MSAPTYRFFPWVRRGLAAALPRGGERMPSRGVAKIRVTVTPEILAEREVRLFGPGDVVGLDHRLVVRTDPRRSAVDVEPNYLATIDFDAPELPWLFTPAGAPADARLPPWLVLVVLDRERVADPKVVAGRPLPFVTLEGGTPATELPDLADSWAWAHAQRLCAPGDAGDDVAALAQAPDLNVSRLVAPRRLRPGGRWLAAVVPAFDAGREAGLGRPRTDAPLGPAWRADSRDLELPVYYFWEFDTAAKHGDFEYLARNLKAVRSSSAATSGGDSRQSRLYVGTAETTAGTVAALPADAPSSYVRVDSPLEATDRALSTSSEVPAALAEAIVRATTHADDTQSMLPPLYGDRHARRFAVESAHRGDRWLDELNLDPRTRIAAREGGDVVRRFQEALMEAAWSQIGDVLSANAQLSRSRFLALAAVRGLERHVLRLPAARQLALTAPLHARLPVGQATLSSSVARSSLPDASFDGSLRRLTSPVGRLSRRLARSVAAPDRVAARQALARGIAESLQRNAAIADPGRQERDGIGGLALGRLAAERAAAPRWGTSAELTDETFDAELLGRPVRELEVSSRARPDLAARGILGDAHLRAVASLAGTRGTGIDAVLDEFRRAATASPDAVRFAVRATEATAGAPQVVAIERERGGALVMVESVDRARTSLMTVAALRTVGERGIDAALAAAPSALLTSGKARATVVEARGGTRVEFELSGLERGGRGRGAGGRDRSVIVVGGVQRRREARAGNAPADHAPLFAAVLPPPTRDATAIAGLTGALTRLAAAEAAQGPAPRFLRAAIGPDADALPARARAAIDPASVFRRRAASMVSRPGWLSDGLADVLDPILAAPVLAMPFAELLAKVAPQRFLPADLTLPPESITALATNPRYVTAFLVGANHEMNRELLWRTYPTDARGTPVRRFWAWSDRARTDIEPIHAWPQQGMLAARGGASLVVIVVRGRLLRRYPNTAVLARKAAGQGRLAPIPAGDAATRRAVLREPLFRAVLEPDVVLVGLDITTTEFLDPAHGGWYIVLQEPITEPRFGLDEPDTTSRRRNRNDASWHTTGVAGGGHLPASKVALSSDSAAVADSLLQRPVRVARHASQLANCLPPDRLPPD